MELSSSLHTASKRVPEGYVVRVAIAIDLILNLFVPYLSLTNHLFDMNPGQCSDNKRITEELLPGGSTLKFVTQ